MSIAVKARFSELTEDDEVTAKLQGIDLFLMTGEEKNLNLRSFDKKTIKKVYEKQNHMCPMCVKEGNNREYSLSEMEADHAIQNRAVEHQLLFLFCANHYMK